MKKKRSMLITMALILSVSVFLLSGCGKEQQKNNNAETVESDERDKETEEDVKKTEETGKEESEDVLEAETQDDPADKEESRTATIYYVDDQTAEIVTKTAEVENEKDIWNILKEEGILTEGCEILSFKVNELDKKIDLDFNSATGDRIRSMGTTGEIEIMGCIVNTYLDTYGCDGIRLTEEGSRLETSHGADHDGYIGKMTF